MTEIDVAEGFALLQHSRAVHVHILLAAEHLLPECWKEAALLAVPTHAPLHQGLQQASQPHACRMNGASAGQLDLKGLVQANGTFREFGYLFGVLIIRILLFRVLY